MKLGNLIILIVLALGAYWLLGGKSEPAPAPAAEVTAAPAPPSGAASPTPLPSAHLDGVTRDQLVTVRGYVSSFTPDGMMVACQGNPSADYPSTAGMAAAEAQRITEAAMTAERQKWGDLLVFEGGKLKVATWDPPQTVEGEILLRGHPKQGQFAHGDKVKIIATLLPEVYMMGRSRVHQYTVDFSTNGSLTGGVRPNWMNTRSDLEQPAHR